MRNGFVERLNTRFRDKCLNEHLPRSLPATRRLSEQWRIDYDHDRLNISLGALILNEFVTRFRWDQDVWAPFKMTGGVQFE